MRRWTDAIVDARKVGYMSIVREVQVGSVPAGLKVELCSPSIHAVCVVDVMGFWNIISGVYATETYPVRDGTNVHICQVSCIVVPENRIARYHGEAWWERFCASRIASST